LELLLSVLLGSLLNQLRFVVFGRFGFGRERR
jgi:hypothetical protein